jgi:hypothetical protein
MGLVLQSSFRASGSSPSLPFPLMWVFLLVKSMRAGRDKWERNAGGMVNISQMRLRQHIESVTRPLQFPWIQGGLAVQ